MIQARTPARPVISTPWKAGIFAAAAVIIFALGACGGGKQGPPADATATPDPSANGGLPLCPPSGADASRSLSGAGATFPYALYSKWVDVYQRLCGVKINYSSIGSGAGIQQITARTVDYGASDGIMTDAQERAAVAAGGPILHIPMTFAPEAVVYNLPGIASGALTLDGPTLADIFLGKIKKWQDARLKALNPGLSLPKADIVVAHRSDGSGTTFIFTNYLSKVSPEWQSRVGFATSVSWPSGVGGQGNDGVAGQVKQVPGSIGYVELAYARQTDLSLARIINHAGRPVLPSLESATAAAQGVTIPADAKVLLTDSTNADAYPITGFTWVLAFVDQADAAKGRTLAYFLWWSVHNAQRLNKALDFASLSPEAVRVAEAQILQLTCADSPCLSRT